MCRRKRSRPSSKRRLTKNVKRLSSGRSVCASAIGVVDEHRLSTNGPALVTAAAICLTSALARTEAKLGVAVIHFPENPNVNEHGLRGLALIRATEGDASARAYCAIVAAPPS